MKKVRNYRNALIAGCVLVAAGLPVQAKGYSPPEPLPLFNSQLTTCLDGVVKLAHGTIESQRRVERHGNAYYVFATRERDGTEWLIACDSSSGRIVKAVGLDGI